MGVARIALRASLLDERVVDAEFLALAISGKVTRLARPPVDLLAVCEVRAMSLKVRARDVT